MTPGRELWRGVRLTVSVAVVAFAVSAATADAELAPGAVVTRLSNLHTLTRWAYPSSEAPVHASPSVRSRAIGHLRLLTDDEQAELYVALASVRLSSGATWVEIEFPARPNGQR